MEVSYPESGTEYGSNWTGVITGTASAASGATVEVVSVAIEDTATKLWWEGSSFDAPGRTFVAATGTTTWLFLLSPDALTPGVTYKVTVRAADSHGDTGTSPKVVFTYSIPTGPPTVEVTYPVDTATYGTDWTGTITGTSSSNSGRGTAITATDVAIEDTTTAKWWNGSSFSAGSKRVVPVSGTTTWLMALAATDLTPGDAYRVVAEATDTLGNTGSGSPVHFAYSPDAAPAPGGSDD